jgi:hypothetical protein
LCITTSDASNSPIHCWRPFWTVLSLLCTWKRFWRTPRHTVAPWLSTALLSWLHLQWKWGKRQRR